MIDAITSDYPLTITISSTTHNMLDFSFKPIPKSSPIPPGVVALIGGALPGIFGLCKDGKEIIIEYPDSDEPRNSVDPNDPCYDYWVLVKTGERHAHFLEIVVRDFLSPATFLH